MSSSRNHYLEILTSLRVAAPDHAVTDLNKDERGDGLSELPRINRNFFSKIYIFWKLYLYLIYQGKYGVSQNPS